jgi:hypothetical protein
MNVPLTVQHFQDGSCSVLIDHELQDLLSGETRLSVFIHFTCSYVIVGTCSMQALCATLEKLSVSMTLRLNSWITDWPASDVSLNYDVDDILCQLSSADGKATGCGLDFQGSIPDKGKKYFSSRFRPTFGPLIVVLPVHCLPLLLLPK